MEMSSDSSVSIRGLPERSPQKQQHGKPLIPEGMVLEVAKEFQSHTRSLFGDNLVFAFIFGGFAKGYATEDHDIDMFVSLKSRNPEQETKFKEFYFDIHKRYKLMCDYHDPGEINGYADLQKSLALLESIKIKPVIKYYREYEAIVWGDIFSGKIIAETGDVECLRKVQSYCSQYPEKWRKEILELIDEYTLNSEWETIKALNVTRLFRRFVTYLKLDDNYVGAKMQVCILGGGGNVAEAIAANLTANGHIVSQFRFGEQLSIPGVPKRPVRSIERLNNMELLNVSNQPCELKSQPVKWITADEFADIDVFVFAFPSYMAEKVGELLGTKLANKPLINLSDRFLGTYALMATINRLYGPTALPNAAVCFNGVPIMALKANRDAPTSVYYVKPKHSIAWYPQTREGRTSAYRLLFDLFKFEYEKLIPYSSMLHLAFENAHCIEHAVIDLSNLTTNRYAVEGGGFLYSNDLYRTEAISRISKIIAERDEISEKVLGRSFASLKDYDLRVFGSDGNPNLDLAGTCRFRTQHSSLSMAPSLLKSTAFGYEDVGWSMVTLESFAKWYNISTPSLSALIDEWNTYMNCDYRLVGRTITSLSLKSNADTSTSNYRDLNWLESVVPQRLEPTSQ